MTNVREFVLDLEGLHRGVAWNHILEEMAKREGIELAFAEKTLKRLQEFDPIGVASRNLQECLLLQVKHLAGDYDFDLDLKGGEIT